MTINRKVFFEHIRAAPAGGFLGASQVDGFSRILDEWDKRGLSETRYLAYMLATCWHETYKAMQPIKEFGGMDYLKSKPYFPWYGRGLVQCTWEANYAKFSCKTADDMLTWPYAVRALFDGMINGVFTGRRLGQYFNATLDDAYGARHIINGTDKAGLIAGYHAEFLAAIKAAEEAPAITLTPNAPVLDSIEAALNRADVASHQTTATPVVSHKTASAIDNPTPPVADVRWLQGVLSDLGYYRGPVDADFGPYTDTAVRDFQRAHGLVVDGVLGDATYAALDAAKVVKAAAAPPVPSPGPIPGLVPPKAVALPYQPPAVPGPHLVPAVSRPGFWARFKAAFGGKAS